MTQEPIKPSQIIDNNTQKEVIASLLLEMNAFVSIDVVEIMTTLDKTTQYRFRIDNRFPPLETITAKGRRKAYRLQDVQKWLDNPIGYRSE